MSLGGEIQTHLSYLLDELISLSLYSYLFCPLFHFWLKIYCVWYKCSNPCFLLFSMCMEFLFYWFTLSPYLPLHLKCISCRHIVGSFFSLFKSVTMCFLIGLNPLTFRVNYWYVRLMSILLLAFWLFCISIVSSSVSAYLCNLVIFCGGVVLRIYSGFLLCFYHEGYMKYLIEETIHFKLIAT